MKKKLLIIILFFVPLVFKIFSSKKESENNFKVAILTPISHPALEDIQKGFCDYLLKYIKVNFDIYNGNGNLILMKSQVEECARKDYDLICTIATTPFLLTKETFEKKEIKTPIIALAAEEEQINLNKKEKSYVLVNDLHDFKKQIGILSEILNINEILLPFAVTPSLENQVKEIKEICENLGMNLIPIKIYTQNEIYIKTETLLDEKKSQIIMILKDNLIVSNLESLITLSKKRNIPVYASDLNSVDKGANFGFGVYEDKIGEIGAKEAVKILLEKVDPNSIPTVFLKDFYLKFNNFNYFKKLSFLKEKIEDFYDIKILINNSEV